MLVFFSGLSRFVCGGLLNSVQLVNMALQTFWGDFLLAGMNVECMEPPWIQALEGVSIDVNRRCVDERARQSF